MLVSFFTMISLVFFYVIAALNYRAIIISYEKTHNKFLEGQIINTINVY